MRRYISLIWKPDWHLTCQVPQGLGLHVTHLTWRCYYLSPLVPWSGGEQVWLTHSNTTQHNIMGSRAIWLAGLLWLRLVTVFWFRQSSFVLWVKNVDGKVPNCYTFRNNTFNISPLWHYLATLSFSQRICWHVTLGKASMIDLTDWSI